MWYRDEYVASVNHAAEVNRNAAQAKVAYLIHNKENHTEGSLQTKLEMFKWTALFRDEAQAMAEEARRKTLALQDMDEALRDSIAQLVES